MLRISPYPERGESESRDEEKEKEKLQNAPDDGRNEEIGAAKLGPLTVDKITVGYTDMGYDMLDLTTGRVTASCNITFIESRTYGMIKAEKQTGANHSRAQKQIENDGPSTSANLNIDSNVSENLSPETSSPNSEPTLNNENNESDTRQMLNEHNYALSLLAVLDSQNDLKLSDNIPKSYQQAQINPFKDEWNAAICNEFDSHNEHNTWTLVLDPGNGKNIISSKWVFSVRYAIDGKEMPKARLVAIGCADVNMYSTLDLSSPVCLIDIIRLLLSLAHERNFSVTTMDVSVAYLNSILDREIYLRIPAGLDIDPRKYKLRLNKTIYGLKIAENAGFLPCVTKSKKLDFARAT